MRTDRRVCDKCGAEVKDIDNAFKEGWEHLYLEHEYRNEYAYHKNENAENPYIATMARNTDHFFKGRTSVDLCKECSIYTFSLIERIMTHQLTEAQSKSIWYILKEEKE